MYDNSGTNIAQGKTATSASQYPGSHQPVLAFDGSLDTKYRSNYDVEEDWLEVDLGSVIEIHKIVIKHTGSEDVYEGVAMKDGLRGYIEIFDGNGSIGKTTQIGVTSTDDVYTYNFKERGGGKWRGGQGLLKSRADIIAKKQADADAEQKRLACRTRLQLTNGGVGTCTSSLAELLADVPGRTCNSARTQSPLAELVHSRE